jgi:hypothetical protein
MEEIANKFDPMKKFNSVEFQSENKMSDKEDWLDFDETDEKLPEKQNSFVETLNKPLFEKIQK